MKDVAKAEEWMDNTDRSCKEKLGLDDALMADLHFRHAMDFYTKDLTRCLTCPLNHHPG